jgi:hypothetical protein
MYILDVYTRYSGAHDFSSFSIGIAYAGSQREDELFTERMRDIVADTSISMEIASLAALSLGFIFVGSANGEIASTILQTMMERDEKELKEKWGRFMALGLALLYLSKIHSSVFLEVLCSRTYQIRPARCIRRHNGDA